eukprot:COSAG01_NODE_167_length_23239_cov_14.692457_4_plen_829_part_00
MLHQTWCSSSGSDDIHCVPMGTPCPVPPPPPQPTTTVLTPAAMCKLLQMQYCAGDGSEVGTLLCSPPGLACGTPTGPTVVPCDGKMDGFHCLDAGNNGMCVPMDDQMDVASGGQTTAAAGAALLRCDTSICNADASSGSGFAASCPICGRCELRIVSVQPTFNIYDDPSNQPFDCEAFPLLNSGRTLTVDIAPPMDDPWNLGGTSVFLLGQMENYTVTLTDGLTVVNMGVKFSESKQAFVATYRIPTHTPLRDGPLAINVHMITNRRESVSLLDPWNPWAYPWDDGRLRHGRCEAFNYRHVAIQDTSPPVLDVSVTLPKFLSRSYECNAVAMRAGCINGSRLNCKCSLSELRRLVQGLSDLTDSCMLELFGSSFGAYHSGNILSQCACATPNTLSASAGCFANHMDSLALNLRSTELVRPARPNVPFTVFTVADANGKQHLIRQQDVPWVDFAMHFHAVLDPGYVRSGFPEGVLTVADVTLTDRAGNLVQLSRTTAAKHTIDRTRPEVLSIVCFQSSTVLTAMVTTSEPTVLSKVVLKDSAGFKLLDNDVCPFGGWNALTEQFVSEEDCELQATIDGPLDAAFNTIHNYSYQISANSPPHFKNIAVFEFFDAAGNPPREPFVQKIDVDLSPPNVKIKQILVSKREGKLFTCTVDQPCFVSYGDAITVRVEASEPLLKTPTVLFKDSHSTLLVPTVVDTNLALQSGRTTASSRVTEASLRNDMTQFVALLTINQTHEFSAWSLSVSDAFDRAGLSAMSTSDIRVPSRIPQPRPHEVIIVDLQPPIVRTMFHPVTKKPKLREVNDSIVCGATIVGSTVGAPNLYGEMSGE